WAYAFHQDKASSVRVPVANVTLFSSVHFLRENTDSVRVLVGPVFLLGLLVPAIVAAYASRAAVTLSTTIRWSFLADLEFIDGIQKNFLRVMLRLELHIAFLLAVEKPILGLHTGYTSCFSGLIQSKILQSLKNL
ncbi:hypothetical protein Tco_0961604, partial [Tanacetum coccineum]